MQIYDFTVQSIDGRPVPLAEFCGKVLLIVNTASKCGFTPQYAELEMLYTKWKGKGFEVLGFPCNQFLDQEPDSNESIQAFCQKNYGVTFPMFAKIDVNGPNASPLYDYLRAQEPFGGFDLSHPIGKKLDEILSEGGKNYQTGNDIKWNFTKFLVDRTGEVVQRFEPTAPLGDIEEAVARLLK